VQVTPKPLPTTPPPDRALQTAIGEAATDIARAGKLKSDAGKHIQSGESDRLDAFVREIRAAKTAQEARTARREMGSYIGELEKQVARRRQEDRDRQEIASARSRARPTVQKVEGYLRSNRSILQDSERRPLQRRLDAVKNATTKQGIDSGLGLLQSELANVERVVAARIAGSTDIASRRYSEGAQAYFEGKYDEAVPALDQASGTIKDQADLFAILGSALYKKYILTKSEDDSLRSRAEQAFRSAVRIDRNYNLDDKYFPPKVIAFFQQVAGGR
jgi:hypothetical protein